MKNLNFLTNKLIAHRGMHNYKYIENTIDSFKRAIIYNYIIELDIRLLRDGTIIVYHDDNLKRLTNIDKKLKECTYDEIKNIENIKIPTFKEVLDLIDGKVPVVIDYKDYGNCVGCLERESVRLLDNYKGLFSVQSFNPLTVLWFKLNRPSYIRGQLVNNIYPKNFLIRYILSNMFTNIITKPDYIGANLDMLDNDKIIRLRKKCLVIGYTVKSRKELIEYGEYADNFICDIGKEPFY